MAHPDTKNSMSRASALIGKIELPWLVLAALLLSTLLAAFQSSRQVREDTDARFAEIALGEARNLTHQLRDVESHLHSSRAFATAMPALGQATWDTYAAASLAGSHLRPVVVALALVPGIDTLGVPTPAPPDRLTPAWTASPAFVEALKLATSTKTLVMSQHLDAPVGVLPSADCVAVVLPLEANNTQPGGAVVAVVDLAAMLAGIERETTHPLLRELFDGAKRIFPTAAAPSVAASSGEMRAEFPVEFGQRALRLNIRSTLQLEKTLRSDVPRAILVIGIFGTVLLGALVVFLTRMRQQAESLAANMTRKLQDQTRFTEDLIEFNPNPIFRKDMAGKFVVVNQAWEQLTGRNRKEILGKTSEELQPAEAFAMGKIHDATVFASASGYEAAEISISHKDGRQFDTIIAKKVLKRADGAVDGIIGTITDVTLTKKLERELARQREQLDFVIRSSQQGIWDIELKQGGAFYYSDRFREILGYTSATFPTVFNWEDHAHPDDYPEGARKVIAYFKGASQLFDIESRFRRRDRSYVWVSVRGLAQRNAQGRAIRFVGSISDVSARKAAEVALSDANIRVLEAARAKESFLATMSHEIRTPLNGVLGMASLLADTDLNDEQRDYIRLIRTSGDTLLRLIGDVLDFSKIESGHMTLESVAVELVPLVEEALELVAEKAREKGLALLFDMESAVPFYILGDPTRLRQILLNLLSNAIKFTDKGEVSLHLKTRRKADGQLELEGRVTDSGIGIPAERVAKLFQPFTQVDASTTRKYGGTGLGLAIVQRLSQLMGGVVGIESIEGKGSTFTFTLTTSATDGPQKPYMRQNVAEFRGKRVLVVDNNANRRTILQHRYARWGFDVVTTASANAVALFAEGRPFDILLAELEIAPHETAAMCDTLEKDDRERQHRGQAPISVILQSAYPRSELAHKKINPEIRHDAFVMRPAGRSKIFDVLMRAALHQPNTDVATRPFTATPVYDEADGAISGLTQPGASLSVTAPSKDHPRGLPSLKIGGRPVKVLVAEDNEINQQVVLGMLKNLGCDSELACDGNAAVEKAVANRYDIILMDIHMPELDGVTAMQNIRGLLVGGSCPPIVAMTAHALPGDREHYLAVGMNDYVAKPIRKGDLIGLFERLLPAAATPRAKPAEPKTPLSPTAISPISPLPHMPPISAVPPTTTAAIPNLRQLPILDTEQLEDLRNLPGAPGSGDSTTAVGGLIALFRTKADERMAEMERLLAGSQWSQLAEIAHNLRGSSASMGFPRVAAHCKDLELAARRVHTDPNAPVSAREKLADMLARIKFHDAEANTALQQWLADNAAPLKQS